MEHCRKLEYVWIDGYGKTRSKTKLVRKNYPTIDSLPIWNYDGSSTNQALGRDSEVMLHPVARFPDPFRRTEDGRHELILCETYLPNGKPHPSNTRATAVERFEKNLELKPMFGIEQEFFLVKNGRPVGFPKDSYPEPQGPYYCGTGGTHMTGRPCVEEAFDNALYAGIQVTGLNAEVAPSQWEIQVCATGVAAADQVTVLRYILDRTSEKFGWSIELHPKPVTGDWNGSGCHTNYSTLPMREKGGFVEIMKAIKRLEASHLRHMAQYGTGNRLRMTGAHETASYDKFSYGVANRGASIRIPRDTEKNNCGYFEDRRPASNMDPYVVTSLIFETTTSETDLETPEKKLQN